MPQYRHGCETEDMKCLSVYGIIPVHPYIHPLSPVSHVSHVSMICMFALLIT